MSVPTTTLKDGFVLKRLIIGLWQVADLERDGGLGLDEAKAVAELKAYCVAGLTTFDMADHYGSAEDLFGKLVGDEPLAKRARADTDPSGPMALTKWVPKPGEAHATAEAVDAAVQSARSRTGLSQIPLLQFHTWDFCDGPGRWLEQLRLLSAHTGVERIGLTNTDTEHVNLALAEGLPVVSNQVCFSLLDRRAAGAMTALCQRSGVRLLAFGVLAGGLLTDRWLGRAAPSEAELAGSWSLSKYYRFMQCFGGWELLQELLRTLRAIANRRGTSIAAVAVRWVLEQPAVASVIVGARLGVSTHVQEQAKPFEFELSAEDQAEIEVVLARSKVVPGDCGDEYRRPPFLTASGDLSHHLATVPNAYSAKELRGHTAEVPRLSVSSGSVWESIASFSRAVRVGQTIHVSGTTATGPSGKVVGGKDAGAQCTFALDIIEAALKALGASLDNVVRTRLYVRDVARDWEAVARAHGARFAARGVQPANTLVGAALVGNEYLVEVEVEALV